MTSCAMPQTLGHLIRERRKRVPMTQEELAARLGISRSWVKKLEQDRFQQPDVTTLNRIAEIIPVSGLEIARAVGYNISDGLQSDAELLTEMLAAEDEVTA